MAKKEISFLEWAKSLNEFELVLLENFKNLPPGGKSAFQPLADKFKLYSQLDKKGLKIGFIDFLIEKLVKGDPSEVFSEERRKRLYPLSSSTALYPKSVEYLKHLETIIKSGATHKKRKVLAEKIASPLKQYIAEESKFIMKLLKQNPVYSFKSAPHIIQPKTKERKRPRKDLWHITLVSLALHFKKTTGKPHYSEVWRILTFTFPQETKEMLDRQNMVNALPNERVRFLVKNYEKKMTPYYKRLYYFYQMHSKAGK